MDKFQDFLIRKCFEISYAMGRLAANCASLEFSGHLQKDSLELIEKAHFSSYNAVVKMLDSIGQKLKIGLEMNFVSGQNFQILNGEIAKLNAAIEEYSDNLGEKDNSIDIKNIFSGERFEAVVSRPGDAVDGRDLFLSEVAEEGKFNDIKNGAKFSSPARFDVDSLLPINKSENKDSSFAAIGGEMRQSAILGKIRQSGYCRLKDIQGIIPDSSERTLRYDLQKLIDQGAVERIGSGGPASFYRLRRGGGDK